MLGHEASGTIEQTGPGVTGLNAGDRVLVCDQIPCGQCAPCLTGKMVYCTDTGKKTRQRDRLYLDGEPIQQYLGISALADFMLTDASAVIPIPSQITFAAAALLGCCLTTGAAAIFNTASLRPGQSALIIGCGGVGIGAIQAARIAGATTIIAADPEPHRRHAAATHGATCTINPAEHDLLKTVLDTTGNQGVDIAIEAVGSPELAAAAFSALAPAGKAIIIGMMPPYSTIIVSSGHLRHGRSLSGSVMGEVRTRHDIPAYQQMTTLGLLHADELATSHWPLDDINNALSHATARNGIRTMITFPNASDKTPAQHAGPTVQGRSLRTVPAAGTLSPPHPATPAQPDAGAASKRLGDPLPATLDPGVSPDELTSGRAAMWQFGPPAPRPARAGQLQHRLAARPADPR